MNMQAQLLPAHISGDSLDDARLFLEDLAVSGASGTLHSEAGMVRLAAGQVVKYSGEIFEALVRGARAQWIWRAVDGRPNGVGRAPFAQLLMATAAELDQAAA